MSRKRERLDRLMVERGLVDSRSRAQALIRAGDVRVAGQPFDKPGMPVARDATIELREAATYVGRGGIKLAAALDAFGVDPTGANCLDVGASTGGFTDCLLQHGARRVYAVDVGRAQLAWSLRQDSRVVNLERQDIRSLGALDAPIHLAVVDVAFISLTLVLPHVAPLLEASARVIALVKPQFEAGRDRVGRGGVVRDPQVHADVLARTLLWAERRGWRTLDAIASPVEGARGNREFLVLLAAPKPAIPGGASTENAEDATISERVAAILAALGFASEPST